MKYRRLPGTELDVSEVCLGTMTWGEQNSEAEGHAQLDYAVAQGVNFIDTAEMYPIPPRAATQGRTESILGAWLARRPRGDLVIATKVAGPGRRDWIRGGRTDLTRDVIAEAVDTSLTRLQIDYIDVFQIHWPQRNVPMFGATEFDPAKETQGSVHPRAGRRHGRHDQSGQDPLLRAVERDRLGRVRVPPSGEGGGRTGSRHDSEQLQPGLAECRQRSRRGAVSRDHVAARVQSAGRRLAERQVSRRREATECPLYAVRLCRPALSQTHRPRSGRRVCGAGRSGVACRWSNWRWDT